MRAPSTRAAPFALAGLVVAAAVVLAVLGRGIATPWILIDELLHAELARTLRAGDGYSVRGHGLSVSWTYPALLAPLAWSYAWLKVLNAVVIALTAVPVYLWGRRLVGAWPAALAAALTLLLPSMLFSSTLMLENLFLPLFVTACLACALALERPTLGRQAAALELIALAAGGFIHFPRNARSFSGTTTVDPPKPPFRIEVRGPAGGHVSFAAHES